MLEAEVVRNLRLHQNEVRNFVVSLSGGLDSTVLLTVLCQIKKTYPLISIESFHLNFQLRGAESEGDQEFVKKITDRLGIKLHLNRVKISGQKGIQEKARAARLQCVRKLPEAELLEAHHGDDQIETFLFRLFRGSGLHGLAGIEMRSEREGRLVWRPFLSVQKSDLLEYANKNKIKFREDSSNQTIQYDRNWIRNAILPRVEKRFPKARAAILRTIEQISEERKLPVQIESVVSPEGWNWEPLKNLDKPALQTWIHERFRQDQRIFLDRFKIVELAEKIRAGKSFSFNAPKNLVLKGRARSRTVPEAKIFFLSLKG